MRHLLLIALAAFFLTTSGGCGGGPADETLRFTAIPDQNTTELQEKLQPLADHLSQQLGVPVEYLPVRDYQASVELFRNGDVLLAWFGGLTGVQARQAVPGARAIAQGLAIAEMCNTFATRNRQQHIQSLKVSNEKLARAQEALDGKVPELVFRGELVTELPKALRHFSGTAAKETR